MDDLISRAAAIEALSTPCDKRYRHGVWETCLDNIETAIRNIPAVDAAPVVHARWKSVKAGASNNYPFWDSKCSECGYTTAMTQTGWLYCPHCGAKMDGERRESECQE